MTRIISPGSVIGVLGSGQLGRMFTIAARRMGYRVHVLSPDTDTPTGQVADVEVQTGYDDLDAIARFARQVDVMTFEFENVPATAIAAAARHVPIRPGGHVLHTTQHRLREKTFLRDAGLPVTTFAAVHSPQELSAAMDSVGFPAILKTAAWGYDGKGQVRIASRQQAMSAWQSLGCAAAILERHVDFAAEISIVAARGVDGALACYDPIRNVHRSHILDISSSPACLPPKVAAAAIDIARQVMARLEVVGVLCIEFFLTHDHELLINELAPRPHNSGHLTIDAHVTDQFEQQVRAVCGLPLGATEQLRPAAMANLLGDVWAAGPPRWDLASAIPGVKLHLYGKREPRPGRKMGHVTVLAADVHTAIERCAGARRLLQSGAGRSGAIPMGAGAAHGT